MTNTGKMAHCDALGDHIVIGKRYGYSKNDNGFTHVVIGLAMKLTSKGVSIGIQSSMRGLYEDDPKPYEMGNKNVSVKGMLLFPICAPPARYPGTALMTMTDPDDIELD